jgi:hypothetical protein
MAAPPTAASLHVVFEGLAGAIQFQEVIGPRHSSLKRDLRFRHTVAHL